MLYLTELTSSDSHLDDATREKMVSVINGVGVCRREKAALDQKIELSKKELDNEVSFKNILKFCYKFKTCRSGRKNHNWKNGKRVRATF